MNEPTWFSGPMYRGKPHCSHGDLCVSREADCAATSLSAVRARVRKLRHLAAPAAALGTDLLAELDAVTDTEAECTRGI